jgi:hypothetical protein
LENRGLCPRIRLLRPFLFAEEVPRDVGFLLEEVRREYDTGRIFYNSVSVGGN